jgi:hypothetical protein
VIISLEARDFQQCNHYLYVDGDYILWVHTSVFTKLHAVTSVLKSGHSWHPCTSGCHAPNWQEWLQSPGNVFSEVADGARLVCVLPFPTVGPIGKYLAESDLGTLPASDLLR